MNKQFIFFLFCTFISANAMEKEVKPLALNNEGHSNLMCLPNEIKAIIATYAIKNSDSLKQAITTIRSLSEVNNNFYKLINDPKNIEKIIAMTKENFLNEKDPLLMAAVLLNTRGAVEWAKRKHPNATIKEYASTLFSNMDNLEKLEQFNKPLFNLIFNEITTTLKDAMNLFPIVQPQPRSITDIYKRIRF